MFSRLIRGKAEMQPAEKPLRGMPALKQKRSSQRQEALMPRLSSPTSLPPRQPQIRDTNGMHQHNGRTNTKCVENGHAMSDPSETKARYRQQNGLVKERQPYKNPNRLSYQEPPANKGKSHGQGVATKQSEDSAKKSKQKSSFSSDVRKAKSESSSPTQKSNNKGRNLHSIKKVRKESRESAVSTSMRALTPRERESIRFLEEIIQQHDEWCLDDYENAGDENVFSETNENDDDTDSDTTSVGSIIDLVGNLSSSCSSPQMSDSRVSVNSNYNNNGYGGNEEVDDVYAQVDRRFVQKKRAVKAEAGAKEAEMHAEPVYAAVKKPKKKKDVKSKRSEPKYEEPMQERSQPYAEEPTAKSSRIFWQKMNAKGSPVKPPTPEALHDGKVRLTPSSGHESPHAWERSNNIEHVPGSSKNNFVVRPGKGRGSTSSRSSEGSSYSDHGAKPVHVDKNTMYLDISPNTPPPKSDFKRTPDTDSDADSGCQVEPSMMAIPRHMVMSASPNKPFVLTTAKSSVISLS